MMLGGYVAGFEAQRFQPVAYQPGAGQVSVARRIDGGNAYQFPQKFQHVFAEDVYLFHDTLFQRGHHGLTGGCAVPVRGE